MGLGGAAHEIVSATVEAPARRATDRDPSVRTPALAPDRRPRRGRAAAVPRAAARPGTADGRGLHARLPRAGAARRDPEPRLPPPVRAREPVGARRRVQGVRRLAARPSAVFGLLQQLAIMFGVYALARRWGRDPRGHRRGHVGAHHHPDRAHGAGVGRRRRPRGRAASRPGVEARATHRRATGARAAARSPPACCSGSRCCSGPTSSSASGSRRRAAAGASTAPGVKRHRARASRRACSPYVIQLATAGPGPRVPGHGDRPRLPAPRRAQPPDPAVVEPLRRLPAEGRRARAQSRGRSPRRRRPHQLFLWFFLLLGAIALVSWQGWQATPRRPQSITARTSCSSSGCSASGSCRRRCSASTPPTSRGSAASPFAFLPIAHLRARAPPARPTGPRRAGSRSPPASLIVAARCS